MTTYVIRKNCFFYGDDYDHFEGSKIEGYFYSRDEAEVVYKKLEVKAVQWIILEQQESLFGADKIFLQELDNFVFSCCGEHILIQGYLQMELPENMQEDDIFEFVKRAKIEKYQIFEFEDDVKFLAIWNNFSQQWLYSRRETGYYLAYGHSMDDLMEQAYISGYYNNWIDENEDHIEYCGKLEDLTDSPTLVRQILEDTMPFWAEYDEKQQKLKIRNSVEPLVFKLNPLLKQPIFTIKEISLAEVLEIEQALSEKI